MTYWVEQQPNWPQQLKYYSGMLRLAEVEELGGACVYLLSDAASYATSIDIPVNGVIEYAERLTLGSFSSQCLHLETLSAPVNAVKHVVQCRSFRVGGCPFSL